MRFEIPGRPMPKQRPRVGRYGNIYTPRETKAYEELVGTVARKHCKEPLVGDIKGILRKHCTNPGSDSEIDAYTL